MFRSLALTAFAACSGHASAAAAPELFPVARDGVWGYIDRYGTLVISPRFERVENFHDGIASVRDHAVARGLDELPKAVAAAEWTVIPRRVDSAHSWRMVHR